MYFCSILLRDNASTVLGAACGWLTLKVSFKYLEGRSMIGISRAGNTGGVYRSRWEQSLIKVQG